MTFAQRLILWQRQYGRHDLPWQVRDPYCVWLSEIMLQQTQVSTVLHYYPRFLARFANVYDLAKASEDEVLQLWAGLGYYARARHLHAAAQYIVRECNGQFPQTRLEWEALKGVGRSTAAAICAFAFHQRESILDGNVKRVLCRVFALSGSLKDKTFEETLWTLAESLLPEKTQDMPSYTQGLMDLGATICKRNKPLCSLCPMADICQAKVYNRIADFPVKTAAIEVQTLTLFWAIIRRQDGAIYVEKRPAKGIWASLYCVPCFQEWASLQDFMAQYTQPENGEEQTTFTHWLTHRLLEIIPIEYTIGQPEQLKKGVWLKENEWEKYALPKPLQNYFSGSLNNTQKSSYV